MRTTFLRGLPSFIVSWCAIGSVQAGLLTNPSFEDNYNPAGPHYGPINGWTGGSGTNRSDGPFHNNGTPVTDGQQMAFLQNSNALTQNVSGLSVGQDYWVQFFYDARACCGGSVDLATKWDGTTLDSISGVTPSLGGAGYKFRNVPFTAAAESGTLALTTTVLGDGTGLLDAVCIVPHAAGQVPLMNPSFEASGTQTALGPVAGWTGSGAGLAGVDVDGGTYANNGTIPEQDHVGYIQGEFVASQTLRALVQGETYAVSFRYNATTGEAPELQVKVDGNQIFSQAVTPVGGVAAYRSGTANFVAGSTSAELSFAQTSATGNPTVLLDDIRVTGVVVEPLPDLQVGPAVLELGPGNRGTVSIAVSARRLELGDAIVKVRMTNENVARFVDADVDGLVTLTFPANGPDTVLTTEVEGVGRGATIMAVVENGDLPGVNGSVRIDGVTSHVLNASFESTGATPGVGYGPIMAWSGGPDGRGLNTLGMPFFDNGTGPDRNQVAFLQGSQALNQMVTGLTPGQTYQVQAFYNVRNCCGGTMDFKMRFAGAELLAESGVSAVGAGQPFHFAAATFTAAGTDGLLEFTSTAAGDATLLLDAVCIVPVSPGEITIKNPSFEASGTPAGVGYQEALAGWSATGGHGVNVDGAGPFSDNGTAGAQDRVAFIQGTGASLSQVIEGLIPNEEYTLTFLVNARNGDSAGPTPYQLLIDGATVFEDNQTATGGANPYTRRSIIFKPNDVSATVRVAVPATEDQSLLLDDFHLYTGNGPAVALSINVLAGNAVDITWPLSAPVNLTLQSSPSLTTGTWANVEALPFVEGNLNHVQDVVDGPKRFYRLVKP